MWRLAASIESQHRHRRPISNGRANCRIAMVHTTFSTTPGSVKAGRAISVTVQPGSTIVDPAEGIDLHDLVFKVRTRPYRAALLAA